MQSALPTIAGVIEFVVAAMLFFVGASSLTGYLILGRAPWYRSDPVLITQLGLGIFALLAFFCLLAGCASAIKRINFVWTILSACLALIWGVSLDWYGIIWVTSRENLNITLSIGSITVFLSIVSLTLLLASRNQFGKKRSDLVNSQ